jgi:hypothetical protein
MREKSPLSEGLVDLNESIKELTAIFHNVSGVGSALAGERTSSQSPFLARMIDWISDDAEALIEHLHPINRETVDSRGLGSYLLPGRGHTPLSVNVNLSGVRGPIEQAMGTAVQNAFHEANRQALAAVAAG